LNARWKSLAKAKLLEPDDLAKGIAAMRRALEIGLKCGCVRVEDCARSSGCLLDVRLAVIRRSRVLFLIQPLFPLRSDRRLLSDEEGAVQSASMLVCQRRLDFITALLDF